MNENDIQILICDVKYWLLNGHDGDLADGNTVADMEERISKLKALLGLSLRQELLSYKWRK